MNYKKYDWATNKKNLPKIDESNPNGKNPWQATPYTTCIGQSCCYSGTNYDVHLNQCVPSTLLGETSYSSGSSSSSTSNSGRANSHNGLFGKNLGGFGGL
jgi:hypothetical protein